MAATNMIGILLVLVGGAIGSICRFWWSGVVGQRLGETFPYGTLFVNLVGCLIIGIAGGFLDKVPGVSWEQPMRLFVSVGICGGLTTFSSFSLQTMNLLLSKRWGAAVANIVFSTIFCFGLVATGWWIGHLA